MKRISAAPSFTVALLRAVPGRLIPAAVLATALCSPTSLGADFTPAPQSFRQEVARHSGQATNWPTGVIQLLDAGSDGTLRAFGGGRWHELHQGSWREAEALKPRGPEGFTVADKAGAAITIAMPAGAVKQILRSRETIWVVTAGEVFQVRNGQLESQGWSARGVISQIALNRNGELAVASSAGLFRKTNAGWESQAAPDGLGRLWGASDVLGVAYDSKDQLWFATKAGVACKTAQGWTFHEGRDGLPYNDFTALAAGRDSEVWFATHLGVIRWNGKEFQYRQGPRWLPNDDVISLAVDESGRAWFGTAGGVGCIEHEAMTLAQKAEFYEGEVERYIKRTPYGYTAEAPLQKRADKSTARPDDSDNDGLWTSMYGAGECFAYGATKDSKARTRAKQAFEALRFLQKVTQGGTPSPDKGFIARTIRPIDWPNPNIGRLERDRQEQKDDKLWKAYEPRWPKSADGKWYWKSDTSSDELDGHYFFYPLYFDLVAQDPAEKDRVREVVRDLTDHLISHGFTLTDIDGKPTRWAVYGPDTVNADANWWPERGLNSLSMLTYLAVASYVTGDPRYASVSHELVRKHSYAQNLMYPKAQYGPGSGNQSDDEMAFMCFYTLLRCSKDPEILDRVRYSFFAYWAIESQELNPFFNFAYAAHGLGQATPNIWGSYSISPWAGWHEDSMATLYGFSLDRLNWGHRNSHRLDLVPLTRIKSKDLYEPDNSKRGHRVNGKVLPVENRHFEHWNTDPWHLDYHGNGNVLGSGTVFLLPYYMGMYHGFIEKP